MRWLLSKHGALRLFGSAIVTQAVLSAANLGVGLVLLRYASDIAYGHFVLVQAAVLLAVVAQRAWVIDPLTVLAPEGDSDSQRAMVGSLRFSQRAFLGVCAAVGIALITLAWIVHLLAPSIAILLGVTVLACWAALERDYLRGVLMLYYRPETVLTTDALYAAMLIAGIVVAATAGNDVAIWAVLALAVAAWISHLPAARSLGRNPGWQREPATAYWQQLRPLAVWATVGAVIYWLLGQGYNYVLAFKLDAVAVAHVNAIRLLLMPTYLLTIGIKALLLPMATRWLAEAGFGFLVRRLSQCILALAVLDGVYIAMLWLGGADWIITHVLHKTIPSASFMVLMWSLLSLINLVRDVYLTALLVRQRFKQTARLVAITAVVSILTMWFALDWLSAAGALVGLAVGETVFLVGVLVMTKREAQRALPGEGNTVTPGDARA